MLSTVPNTGQDQFAWLEKMSAVLEAYKDLVETDRERNKKERHLLMAGWHQQHMQQQL